jgi:hypothetical protein
MWIPDSVDAIETAIAAGTLVETSIAAVTVVDIRAYPTAQNPSVGYLLVIVPQSARAPHQVIVRTDLRFYGRGATGNRILTEHEIALLYQRRLSWERDRDALLDDTIVNAPFPANDEFGFLHAFACPVTADPGLWDRALSAAGDQDRLLEELRLVAISLQTADNYDPRFNNLARWDELGADQVRLSSLDERMRSEGALALALDAVFDADGTGRLFSSRAAYTDDRLPHPSATKRLFLEEVIAGNLASFFATMGRLYNLASYHGHVDIGAAVTGATGAQSKIRASASGYFFTHPYGAGAYKRTNRVAAHQLAEPKLVVRDLLRSLFRSATGQADFDPFA